MSEVSGAKDRKTIRRLAPYLMKYKTKGNQHAQNKAKRTPPEKKEEEKTKKVKETP